MRIRSKWYKDKEHTLEEEAGVISNNLWRIAMSVMLNLENADYQTESNKQRLEVIGEILAFCIHVTDRITIQIFDEEARSVFISALAQRCAKSLGNNYYELYGKGTYKEDFINMLNQRMAEYAEFDFQEDGPSFGMKRYFGEYMSKKMGDRHNKWVTAQIIDIEVPQIMRTMDRILVNLK